MDIDISDILADISRPTGPANQNSSSSSFAHQPSSAYDYDYDPSTTQTDHVLLTRAWTCERCTPVLQPYPAALIARVTDRVRSQIARIEDLTSGVYDGAGGASGTNRNLVLSILQTDLSRTQFLVRSYLRQRLAKVEKHTTYYLKYHVHDVQRQASDDGSGGAHDKTSSSSSSLLSAEETAFLRHHATLLSNLYDSSFLMSLPRNLRRLDDNTGGNRMDEGPEGAEGVLVRCLGAEWSNEADVFEEEGDGEGPTVELRVERGGVLVARWRDVRRGVESGDLEVL